MAEDTSSLKSSRPTVVLDGRESQSLTGGLLRARVRENVHGLSDCELEVGNWGPSGGGQAGFLYFDRATVDFGKRLKLTVDDEPVFEGRITGIEARYPPAGKGPSLVMLAEDALQDLRMTRRTRSFTDTSDADVASRIAGDHGLTPDVSISGPEHRVLVQLNQSDLAFLRDRARALDAELTLTDRTLKVAPRGAGGSPITLTHGKELRELRVAADLAGQATDVRVNGWDVAAKSAIAEAAGPELVSGELVGGQSGPDVLRAAFGERPDAHDNAMPQTGDEARARAEALLKRRARRFVAGRGVSETKPGLRVGAKLRLVGLGPLFEGEFYLAAVTHLFDGDKGLRSEIAVERPGLGGAR
jgi:phage protein D